MPKQVGLRTEIIVNLALLMGAALLLAGFLLLKLAERELVAQRVGSAAGVMEFLARTVPLQPEPDTAGDGDLAARSASLFRSLPAALALTGWGAVDRELRSLPAAGQDASSSPQRSDLVQVRYSLEPVAQVHYPAAWLPFFRPSESYVEVTVPVLRPDGFAGALHARFSLSDVRQRLATAHKVMLLYAVLYAAVLVVFAVYFLSRIVVRPVERLQQMTRRVATGDLEQTLPVEGPREIADLAGSFNTMIAALRQSRQESENHIHSLSRANEELRQTRDDLVRSEKMASVGHLAAGMAHEIGNPLGAVVGYLGLLRSELSPGHEQEIAGRALAEAERIDRLVRELLDYAAPAGGEAQIFDPAAALSEASRMLAHQGVFDGLILEDRLPPELPATRMPRHRLVQVFVNLLLNARDACAPGGNIRLAAGTQGEGVWLAVADDGAGIPPEALAHIFDPFYTTKAPGRGRGLGLAVCQRLIGEAGGRIEVRSVSGQGSEFTVWLKKVEAAAHEG